MYALVFGTELITVWSQESLLFKNLHTASEVKCLRDGGGQGEREDKQAWVEHARDAELGFIVEAHSA